MNAWAMLPLRPASISASSSASGHTADLMLNDYAGIVWKSAGGAASVIIAVDLGAEKSVDAALFFGCTGASLDWTLKVESATNASFTTGVTTLADGIPFLAGERFPTHGRGVGFWQSEAAVTARRYWRFTIASLSSAQVSVARLALGARLQLGRNFAFGGGQGVRDLGSADFSAQGVLVRRRAARLRTLGVTFPSVYRDEVEQKVQPLIEMAAGQEPVVIVTDPEEGPERQRNCWFGLLFGELGTVRRNAAGWEWRVGLVDLVPIPKQA
ncbi:hypothetical protein M9978_16390 [Sphingomonas sp. MG17]|uniref:F5/8 type C domain-containing protein n=1 Tax=Sphingomonas tagetis TaxID=2949092 RepID=A0A9X2HSV6_9SPHN|nr:hypothetical protein [Sphingomonas tagetis]MCP3732005.1 hypothetical protein [Sphingomonas tagetis]